LVCISFFACEKNAGTSLTNTNAKSRVLLEKLAVAQPLKKVPVFYKT
jgi:hypothetical protein